MSKWSSFLWGLIPMCALITGSIFLPGGDGLMIRLLAGLSVGFQFTWGMFIAYEGSN